MMIAALHLQREMAAAHTTWRVTLDADAFHPLTSDDLEESAAGCVPFLLGPLMRHARLRTMLAGTDDGRLTVTTCEPRAYVTARTYLRVSDGIRGLAFTVPNDYLLEVSR